ncbi:hypothetical protein DSO57_1019474 [Entomophthora muscae]|uniref:Uncharacterized protein n=1 Tax=Entomophthora muscae TaxID=34485 RepID=A0ACC2T4F3_9FUNG|nr:hypothetical protein DSO57_1019474 [Entomophthora muscae]
MKFAEGALVAEGAKGKTIIITRNGDKAPEVAAFTPNWFYGGYQSLVAPVKQINKNVALYLGSHQRKQPIQDHEA